MEGGGITRAPAMLLLLLRSTNITVFSDTSGDGMSFATLLEIIVDGGSSSATKTAKGVAALEVANANSFTILLSAASGFRGFQLAPDLSIEQITAKCRAQLEPATKTVAVPAESPC